MRIRRIILSFVACRAVSYFSALSLKRHDVPKKLIGRKMCVVIFSVTSVSSISHSKKNRARCYRKGRYVVMQSTRSACQILMKLEFSRHIFEKYSNIKFHENPSSGRVVPCGRTDRHDGAHA